MTVKSLELAKLEKHQAKLAKTLDKLEKEGRALFEKAVGDKRVKGGCYDDNRWEMPKNDLLFEQAMGTDDKYFPGNACYRQAYTDPQCVRFIKAYTVIKLSLSETQRRQHNQAAKLVLHMANNSLEGFATLTKMGIEAFMKTYDMNGGGSANGIENAMAGGQGLVAWMSRNGMLIVPFQYNKVLKDKHKLAAQDTTSPEAAEKVYNKRPPADLDTVLGDVLLKTEGGKNEPKPGYFRLRALMCTFMMGAGLRFGEAATLNLDCFVEIQGKTWLKVLSEKVGEPRLVPLGAGWDTLLKKRHEEIMQLTQTARQAAMALEDGSLFTELKAHLEALAKARVPPSMARPEYREHRYLVELESGYFKWAEYVELGLLPKFSEAKGNKFKSLIESGVQVLKGSGSFWIAYDSYESWLRAWSRDVLSDHFNSAIIDLDLENPELALAGYSVDHPLSQHLFIKLDAQFHRARPTKPHIPLPMGHGDLQQFLRSRGRTMSAFEALNVRSVDGRLFELRDKVSTHIFRHWKDDARFRAGGNVAAIAILGGRTPSQARAYDKRTAAEIAEQHKALYQMSNAALLPKDPLGKRVAKMMEVGATEQEIQAVIEETLQIMHLTPWGGCSRDLAREPCPKHYKCLRGFADQVENDGACPNFHIDPTDTVAKANIEHTLRVAKYQFAALERLTSPEMIKETLEELEMDYNPERGKSLLAMQVKHQKEIMGGCEAALRAYESRSAGEHENRHGAQLRQVASVDRIHAVNLIDPEEMLS